jgi:hypothetical protein
MRKILVLIFGVALIAILYLLSSVKLTDREISLFSTALAILSMACSWLITDIYSQKSKTSALEEARDFHKNSLKTYVINASEKVNNISNELDRLSSRLKKISNDHKDSTSTDVLIISERVTSATHIIEALKSVNDTAISDWRGIIGEEIKTFRQKEAEEKEKEISSIMLRIENLEAIDSEDENSSQSVLDARWHLDELLSERGIILNKDKKIQHITRKCPKCRTNIGFDQHTRHSNFRQLTCPKVTCNAHLVSQYDETSKNFELVCPEQHNHNIKCSNCLEEHSVDIINYDDAIVKHHCDCGNVISLKYFKGEVIDTKPDEAQQPKIELTPELVERVRSRLPEQPWEKDIHKIVAREAGISNSLATRIIKRLVTDGIVYDQVDGELFERVRVTLPNKPIKQD